MQRFLADLAELVTQRRVAVLVVMSILTALALAGIPRLQTESSPENLIISNGSGHALALAEIRIDHLVGGADSLRHEVARGLRRLFEALVIGIGSGATSLSLQTLSS